MAKGGFTERDAGRLTNVSRKEVEAAWHDAREDAQIAGELPERMRQKVVDRLKESGVAAGRDDVLVRGGHVEIRSDALHRLAATDPSRAREIVRGIERGVSGATSVVVKPSGRGT